jgi:flagellar protein FliL
MSLVTSIVGVAVITVIAGAAGVAGAWVVQTQQALDGFKSAGHNLNQVPDGRLPKGVLIKPIPTILTNLAGDKRAWARLDLSVLLAHDFPHSERLIHEISQDTLVYLRSVTPGQIEGPTGLAFLLEDLEERAKVRSNGKSIGLLLRSFVIE